MKVEGRTQANGLLVLSELIVEEGFCINLRGRTEQCSACGDVCPSGAIALAVDAVDVDDEKCTGCNSCLPSCPAGALRSSGFVPERFLQAMGGKEAVHLHCRGSSDGGGGIVIPCHGVLDTRLLASARAEGVKSISLHGLDHCEACNMGDARAHIEALEVDLKIWLGEEAPKLDTAPGVDKTEARRYQDQLHLSRRAFLRFSSANTVTQAVDWMVPGLSEEEQSEDLLPFFQAEEFPQRAAQYQQTLSSRVDRVPWRSGTRLPWQVRAVSGNCNGCLSCGERCPTGALQARSDAKVRLLSFDYLLCTNCKLCETICPEDAVIVTMIDETEVLPAGRSTLYYRKMRPCKWCGTPFDPGTADEDVCSICGNEQSLDEEWLGMLSS